MISVVVPLYNCEKCIKKCIESILAQTYTEFEFLIINDGSTDNSLEICREFAKKDSRIRIITQENSGVSVARNRGIEEAKGEYITFVDADDYICPEMLYDMISLSKNSDIVFSGSKRVTPQQEKLLSENIYEQFKSISKQEIIEKRALQMFQKGIMSYAWGKLFKTSIIRENGINFCTEFSIAEDTIFLFDYLKFSKTFSCTGTSPYFYVTYGSGTLTSKFHKNAMDAFDCLFKGRLNFVGNNQELINYINSEHIALFYSYTVQIYSISKLSFGDKYRLLKKYLSNESFKKLLK